MVKLKITWEEFEQLPRTIGYKHEYIDGTCYLTPRQRNCYAVLDLDRFAEPPPMGRTDKVSIRPIEDADWEHLGKLCGYSFHRVPPFGSLTDEEKVTAGDECMTHVRNGGDGPSTGPASIVAVDEKNHPRGALLIVLKPDGYRDDPWRFDRWREPAPGNAIAQRLGQAHLDWVFVSPWIANHGVASTMLAMAVKSLRQMGYTSLTSAFLLGNGESMAWHWRNGFTLLPNPASMRYWEQRVKKNV
jgi:predicted GNAT family acetyltransferase